MTFEVLHRTLYRYSQPVTVSQHTARVEPRTLSGQIVEDFSLRIEPTPLLRKARDDYFGNRVCFFSIQEVHSRLEITAKSRVTIAAVGEGRAIIFRSGFAGSGGAIRICV